MHTHTHTHMQRHGPPTHIDKPAGACSTYEHTYTLSKYTCVYIHTHKHSHSAHAHVHTHTHSQRLDSPHCVPPYLRCGKWKTGWCLGGERGTADIGKNISSSSQALSAGRIGVLMAPHPHCRDSQIRPGVREERLPGLSAGGYDNITFSQPDSAGSSRLRQLRAGEKTAHRVRAPLAAWWSLGLEQIVQQGSWHLSNEWK